MESAALQETSIRHAVYLQRLKSGEANKFLPFLREMSDSIRARLSGDELTELSRSRLNRLLVSTEKELLGILQNYQQQLELSLVNIGEYEADFEARALASLGFDSVVPAPAQVAAAIFTNPIGVEGVNKGKLLDPFIRDWTETDAAAVTNLLRQGAYEGKTNFQIMREVRGIVSKGFKDGELSKVNRHAEAITRTAVQHVASQARVSTWEANDDIVVGYQWVSVLDNRTTTLCRSLDGRVYKIGKGPLPPAHINCRSTTVAELADDLKMFDQPTTRAARSPTTGKTVSTSAGDTYYSWLKKQPAAYQDSVIGPKRGKLLRNGGISAERFSQLQIDRNFNPLTLKEMRELEPLAFSKAGVEV